MAKNHMSTHSHMLTENFLHATLENTLLRLQCPIKSRLQEFMLTYGILWWKTLEKWHMCIWSKNGKNSLPVHFDSFTFSECFWHMYTTLLMVLFPRWANVETKGGVKLRSSGSRVKHYISSSDYKKFANDLCPGLEFWYDWLIRSKWLFKLAR